MMSPFIHALRRQRRAAAGTALIVATLALALGANTAVFGVADALLVRAVPFEDPDRLFLVSAGFPRMRLAGMGLSGPEAVELGELTRGFAAVGPLTFTGLTAQTPTDAVQAQGIEISSGAMAALAVRPAVGRPFSPAEYQPGGARVAILGHGLWTRAFGADPSVVGRTLTIGGVPREIVGVMPARSALLNRTLDVWLPLAIDKRTAGPRADHRFTVIGRAAPGLGRAEARADVERAVSVWREETGELHAPAPGFHPLDLVPLNAATTGVDRAPIAALLCAVAFVLLIACANVSNLLVARAERRRAEVAVLVALGATRGRLLRDHLAEGLLLACAGSAAGLGVAEGLLALIRSLWPAAGATDFVLDYRVLAATAAATLAAGAALGIAPVLRLDLRRPRSNGRGGIRGAGRMRLQQILVAAQIALAVLLSAGAGLMVRTLVALMSIETGIDTSGVMRAQVSLPEGAYPADAQVWSFFERLLDRARALPGVSRAGLMSGLPPLRRANNTSFTLDGVETIAHDAMHQVDFIQHVTPGYFETLRIPLLEGRRFAPADDERAAPVVVVNDTLARRFWPGQSAIGHRLRPVMAGTPWFTVVGVVRDVRQAGVQAPAGSEVYVPFRQSRVLLPSWLPRSMNLVLRGDGVDPAAIGPALRAELRRIDPSAALAGLAAMENVVDRTIARPRLLAWMLGAFAALALAVAAVGVYAVTSCAVAARTAEFGVRMALGARPRDVLALVFAGGILPIGAGVLAGTGAFLLSARLLAGLLFGVQPIDPASLAAGALGMAAAAMLATLVPAGRAARVDPLVALREL
jgi:putative ABC transport system permease protein